MTGYIYRFRNKINGKVYIGQTIDLNRRYKDHLYYAQHNPVQQIHKAIAKYGIENFDFSVLHKIEGEDDFVKLRLNELEATEILSHNSYRCGYNASTGGEGNYGLVHSEETRKKIGAKSRNRSPESNHKISLALKGRVMSEEERQMRAEICKKASAARWKNKKSN